MNTNYAGFWLRFVAAIIDGIILGIAKWAIFAVVGISSAGFFPFSSMSSGDVDPAALIAAISAMFGLAWIVGWAVDILYHSFMESSKFQGSIGKIALGLVVTDTSGVKLDFTKALIRNACKIISYFILCIGYIMAGFTEKKQALHDMIASTLVMKK